MSTDIVKAETDRLNLQKKTIDDALSDKRRLIVLNDSYRKRMTSYTYIAMGITAGALCMLAISFLPIPAIFSNILYVCIIMGVFILILYRYDIISQRSRLDYDELNLPSVGTGSGKLSDETKTQQITDAQQAGQLSAAAAKEIKHCMDEQCCPATWDPVARTCPNTPLAKIAESSPSSPATQSDSTATADSKQAFTTLSDAYSVVSPVVPFEYHSPIGGGLETYKPESGIKYTSL